MSGIGAEFIEYVFPSIILILFYAPRFRPNLNPHSECANPGIAWHLPVGDFSSDEAGGEGVLTPLVKYVYAIISTHEPASLRSSRMNTF